MAGRPKLVINKNDMLELQYNLHTIKRDEILYPCESNLYDILKNFNLVYSNQNDFKVFMEKNSCLINKCRYKTNKRDKAKQTIKYIQSKNKSELTHQEIFILDLFSITNSADIYPEQYFELMSKLDIYRKGYSEKIKSEAFKNSKSEYQKHDDNEKLTLKKNLANQKFFLGGVLVSMLNHFNPNSDKTAADILCEMIKIYTIHEVFFKKERDFLQEFEKHQHFDPISEIARQLNNMTLDQRNPYLDK